MGVAREREREVVFGVRGDAREMGEGGARVRKEQRGS